MNTNGFNDHQMVMVSYLRSGRCWWIFRVFQDDTFDLHYTSEQPNCGNEVKRTRYKFSEIDKVVTVGELKDWIKGLIGKD